jgi:outer membrane cobalamin receptor
MMAAIAAARPLPARAADDAFRLFEEEAQAIRVASVKPETVLNSVSNVTVIDRKMIEAYNYETVADALQTVAGVMVWRTYAMQRVPTFRGALQEHYANKVLVTIDGVPAWNAVTGEGDIDRVGIDSVERIEILRGPASVIYGSNALTGVVNVVLRRPAKDARLTTAAAGVASGHGGFSGAAEVSRVAGVHTSSKEDSLLFLSADHSSRRSPGFSFTDDTMTTFELNEYFTVRNVNARWEKGGHRLLANASVSAQDYGGNSISMASGAGKPHDKEMELLDYSYSFGPSLSNLRYSGTVDRQRRQIPRDAADSLRSDILGTRYVNTLRAEAELPGAFSLELGGSHEYRAAERYNNFVSTSGTVVAGNKMDNRVVWEGSVFGQLGFSLDSWKLLAGTRFTHNAAFGDDVSSRLSAVYMLNERNSLKFMAGQSFGAPTPFELYFQNTPVTVLGNPGLRPEKTSSVELSYLTSWDRCFGQATVYYVDYINTIFRNRGDFTRDGQTFANTNFYDNARRYDAEGVELEARYTARRFSSFAAFNYIHGSRGDSNEVSPPGVFGLSGGQAANFKFVPRYTLSAGASWSIPMPAASGEIFGSLVAYHYSSMETLRTRLPGQAWADASAGFKKGGFKHVLSVRNAAGGTIVVPEYVRQRTVESMPLVSGRRVDYTVSYAF